MTEYKSSFGIKSWAEQDRPREKMMEYGKGILTDAELVAILINSGSKNETAVELSKKILQSVDNNLSELGKLGINELKRFKGIGDAKAITIIAALELGRRRKESDPLERIRVKTSRDAFEFIYPFLADLPNEEFFIVFLNRANKIMGGKTISRGGISGTVVDTRVVFGQALEGKACSIILSHNHPSGNLKPSEEDIKLTKRLKEAGIIMEIIVLDHLIIGNNAYYSFADEGML